jgi:ATP-binding cassette, subfamily A (ABC1), member 5
MFPVAFSLAVDQATYLQTVHGDTFEFSYIFKSDRSDSISIGGCLLMLLVDMILYFVIAIYLDKVVQGEYGRSRPFYFFLMPSYWRGDSLTSNKIDLSTDIELFDDCEKVPDDYENKVGLKIRNLVKTFKTEEKINFNAIDNLNLNVYSGEITAILGHNGAGKTTLFNMLTGFLDATSGSAHIFGYDIFNVNDLDKVREMCGVCPQQDIIYDLLNPYEHLEFYAYIKGVNRQDMRDKIENLLKSVQLWEERNNLAQNLSGGQKRKLCIAISLIGDPKILILDEPTSGMDPQSRRLVWNLLHSLRNDRIILLATHFMDEADILADRKAIIVKGKLKCMGSSLFLKNRFGLGYYLRITTRSNSPNNSESIGNFIKKHIPQAKLDSSFGKELTFVLPLNSVSKFQLLFDDFETCNEMKTIIETIGVSMTTLENVFLQLGDEHEGININPNKTDTDANVNGEMTTPIVEEPKKKNLYKKKPKFFSFIPLPVFSLLRARFQILIRNKLLFAYRFLMPLPSLIISILLPTFIKPSSFYDPNNLPRINLQDTGYIIETNKFALFNLTSTNLDSIINNNLIVNNKLPFNTQPIVTFTENITDLAGFSAGYIVDSVFNQSIDKSIILYNDSALLSIPYLVNTMTNFYSRLTNSKIINASLAAWPKTPTQCDTTNFDAGGFSSLLILGTSFILPIVSFATELVHDRELKCRQQLRLSGVSFGVYWGTSLFCFYLQYLVLPVLVFILIFCIPYLNIDSFAPGGAKLAIIVTTFVYVPLMILVSSCVSFLFNKKDTALAFLSTAFTMVTICYLQFQLTIQFNIFIV